MRIVCDASNDGLGIVFSKTQQGWRAVLIHGHFGQPTDRNVQNLS